MKRFFHAEPQSPQGFQIQTWPLSVIPVACEPSLLVFSSGVSTGPHARSHGCLRESTFTDGKKGFVFPSLLLIRATPPSLRFNPQEPLPS